MFDIPHIHVSVNTDCKFSLEHEQNFISTCFGSLTEIISIFHLIKAYYCKQEKMFWKKE